ncbi:MAG TPA: malto-oligosyltrehalose trehalohydrolase [Cyanothece sp. UBA12306]|nr:malto-oligosyltrehalose trehalohydrolase [Cyanothece sp. UBA12306]
MKLSANYHDKKHYEFTVWAPNLAKLDLKIITPNEQIIPMECDQKGYWKTILEIAPGSLYFYQLDEETTRPDPASYYQPKGVHGPSQVVDHHRFKWSDDPWKNIPLSDFVIYELHVGTFTPEGTFAAIIPRLSQLKELGITAIELMPVSQFPGDRNWGYDGVYPFAVQHSYGGVDGLKELVNACHQEGIAVILDVVYNHLGPEGNYTANFGPYFSHKYQTPWGSALNFDDAYSYGIRNFFIENARYWLREYHIDALRLDAIHGIYDQSAKHFLTELKENIGQLSQQVGRPLYLIAESDLNDGRVIRPVEVGGYGMDAQWSDDFHHCLHTLLTQENQGYYEDFGQCQQLGKAFRDSFAYTWDYSPHRQRYHGNSVSDCSPDQFVVYAQNHDQIGNRMLGERLSNIVSFDALKLAAGAVILSPFIPLLFMGEEYGEESPFLYFISHNDANLVEAVREGRKEEFKSFKWQGEPPDIYDVETFKKCQLKWSQREQGKYQVLLRFHQQLLEMRRQITALKSLNQKNLSEKTWEKEKLLSTHRWSQDSEVFLIMNFNQESITVNLKPPEGDWKKSLDSNDSQWLGQGSNLPQSFNKEEKLAIPATSLVVYQI